MQQRYFDALGNGAFHRIAYTDWGNAANTHVVVCVHGLARNSRDFDYLAAALAPEGLAVAVVLNPLDGLDTFTPGCDDTFGLVDAETVGPDGLTLALVGAVTGGALPVETGPT